MSVVSFHRCLHSTCYAHAAAVLPTAVQLTRASTFCEDACLGPLTAPIKPAGGNTSWLCVLQDTAADRIKNAPYYGNYRDGACTFFHLVCS